MIETVSPDKSLWMQSLIRDRLHPTAEGMTRTQNTIRPHLENAKIAVDEIIRLYPDMESDELACIQELAKDLLSVKTLDQFTLFGLKYTLMTTFLHQKYQATLPDDFCGLDFRKGTTCRKLMELPYDTLLPKKRSEDDARETLLIALTHVLREKAFFVNPLTQSTRSSFNQHFYSCLRDLKDLLNMDSKKEFAFLPVFTPVSASFEIEAIPHSLHTLSLSPEPFMSLAKQTIPPSLRFMVEAHFAHQLELQKTASSKRCQPFEVKISELMRLFCERHRETDPEYWSCLQYTLHYLLTIRRFNYSDLIENPSLLMTDVFESRFKMDSPESLKARCTLETFFQYLKDRSHKDSNEPEAIMADFQLKKPLIDLEVRAQELFAWRQMALRENPAIAELLKSSKTAKICKDPILRDQAFTILLTYTFQQDKRKFLEQISKKLQKNQLHKLDLPDEFRRLYKL
jgi:hypothetical protein